MPFVRSSLGEAVLIEENPYVCFRLLSLLGGLALFLYGMQMMIGRSGSKMKLIL